MKKEECETCGELTYITVNEMGTGRLIFLCNSCKEEFEQCDTCKEYHYKEFINNRICDNCKENQFVEEVEEAY